MHEDYPCLADEIAEPRPDMNIKVTAFKVSRKFDYTVLGVNFLMCQSILLMFLC